MGDEKYWNLMSRYLANDLSMEETGELLEWIDDDPSRADLLKELRDTWDFTKNYPDNFNVDTRAAWQKLSGTINSKKGIQKIPHRRSYTWIGIAASLIILLSISLITYRHVLGDRSYMSIETFAGQHKQVILPDGTKVWLNGHSSLNYRNDFERQDTRSVELKGEAFFEVVKNPARPFIITTGKTITRVLGTSFDIKQEKEGSIKVTVVTGKVSFHSEYNPKQKLLLLPGDAGIISKEGYVGKFRYNDQNFLYWKDKQLVFTNAPFTEVIKTLEEAYDVNFQLKDQELLGRRITTSFNKAPLSQVMDVLEVLLDIRIERSDSVYVVEKKQ